MNESRKNTAEKSAVSSDSNRLAAARPRFMYAIAALGMYLAGLKDGREWYVGHSRYVNDETLKWYTERIMEIERAIEVLAEADDV